MTKFTITFVSKANFSESTFTLSFYSFKTLESILSG